MRFASSEEGEGGHPRATEPSLPPVRSKEIEERRIVGRERRKINADPRALPPVVRSLGEAGEPVEVELRSNPLGRVSGKRVRRQKAGQRLVPREKLVYKMHD